MSAGRAHSLENPESDKIPARAQKARRGAKTGLLARFVNFGKIFVKKYYKIETQKRGGVGIGGKVKENGARP